MLVRSLWPLRPVSRTIPVSRVPAPAAFLRHTYATYNSLPREKPSRTRRVTVRNDDGLVQWGELTTREKAARATQQTMNFGIIVVGAIMTGGVFYLLYSEVFAPDSKTRQFNRIVDRIKQEPQCTALLGDGKEISAYGDNAMGRWVRNRPVATTHERDRIGREHLKMRFYVSGPLNDGVVSVHLIMNPETKEFDYHLLALDVQGHNRVYLENAEAASNAAKRTASKIFGIQWR